MWHYVWLSLVWAGAGLTGNLLVIMAIAEMDEERQGKPPRGSKFIPLAAPA
jgi:hypothetical protein